MCETRLEMHLFLVENLKIGLIFLKVGINCSLLKPGFSARLRNCSIWCYMVYVQFGKKKMDDCIFKLKHIVSAI